MLFSRLHGESTRKMKAWGDNTKIASEKELIN